MQWERHDTIMRYPPEQHWYCPKPKEVMNAASHVLGRTKACAAGPGSQRCCYASHARSTGINTAKLATSRASRSPKQLKSSLHTRVPLGVLSSAGFQGKVAGSRCQVASALGYLEAIKDIVCGLRLALLVVASSLPYRTNIILLLYASNASLLLL